MSNTIIELRHSYVTGNVPSSLANGEIAINTYDGKLFYRGGASNTIQTIERFEGPAGLNGEIQFNDSGVLGATSGLSFNKSTNALTVTGNVTAGNVTTSGTANLASLLTLNKFTLGSQVFYPHSDQGFSVNENYNASGTSDQTAYHFTSGAGKTNVVFTVARTGQFTNGFGITGTSADNKFVIFGEQNNTGFEFRKGVGIQPIKLTSGTLLANISPSGNFLTAGNVTASNVVSQSYIQFGDGSRQYTANAGSGGGTTDTYARETANAAFLHANSAFDAANTASGGAANSFGQIVANGGTILATTANDSLQIVGESGISVSSNVSAKKVIVSVPAGYTFTTADYGFVYDDTNVTYDYGTL